MAGEVKTDLVNENSSGAGVTVDGVPIKDGLVDGRDVAADGVTLDALAGAIAVNQFERDDAESTTTSTTYQNKLTLTTGSVDAGDYDIQWYYETGHSSASQKCRARVFLNGATELANTIIEPKDSANYYGIGGIDRQTLAAGVQTVAIDYSVNPGSTGTSKIRRARLKLFKVG